jgi:hypothetical protein
MRPMHIHARLLTAVLSASACLHCPAAEEPRCRSSDTHLVVERAVADGPGADFLVRPASSFAAAPCRFDPGPNDFVVHHRDAERFRALAGPWLVLDNGTGPDGRELIVWNLEQKREVFRSRYGGLIAADKAQLVFWRATDTVPTAANCPSLAAWRAQALGAAIETQVRLLLADLSVQVLPNTRCAPRQ